MAAKRDQTALLVEVARLYYEHQFSQQQIAAKLGISRPGISRLLQRAREKGIVRIQIIDPQARGTELEIKLKEKFGLKVAMVVPNGDADEQTVKLRLGQAAVTLLDTLLKEKIILGVSWGTTMQAVTKKLRRRPVKGMVVVQLNGGISRAEYDTHASEIAQKIGENYGALPFLLPLPAVVDTAELKQAIVADKNIARTLALARQAEVAMFTVGSFSHESVLVKAEYFEPTEVDDLLQRGAVGDICSRIFDHQGRICSAELNARTIGIELEELQQKPYSIAVAGGQEKLAAIRAGLQGRWFNVLITDEWVATELLYGD
jgi:deoxyribonucleoside regulator